MAVSEIKKILIGGLAGHDLEKETILCIMSMMKTDEQAERLAEFLSQNWGATASDILEAAYEINPVSD